MRGILFEQSSIFYFLIITVVMGGSAAWMTGRACALTWRHVITALIYMFLLAIAVRFLHYVIPYYNDNSDNISNHGQFLSFHYYFIDLIVLLVFCGLGYRYTKVNLMVNQYSWLYKKTSLFFYSKK